MKNVKARNQKSICTILTALFAAIISVGTFINFPLPGLVPIALQDMLAMLSGLLLGPVYGGAAVFVFLVLGCIGLPVFAGKAGIQHIMTSPSGGFLIGYFLAAVAAGLILHFILPRNRRHGFARSLICILIAGVAATVVVFAVGILRFVRITDYDFSTTLKYTLIPFIPGNIIKLILMTALTLKFRPVISSYVGINIQEATDE